VKLVGSNADRAIYNLTMEKAKQIGEEIKKEAKGRVCGDCRYMWGACCRRFTSLQPNSEGNPLRINAPDAVACSRWEKKG
jgi:hypothetical protein